MTLLDKGVIACLALILFCVPWQTAYIIQTPSIGTFGAISITLIDVLMIAVIGMVAIREWHISAQKGVGDRVVVIKKQLQRPSVVSGLALITYIFISLVWSHHYVVSALGALRVLEALVLMCLLVRYRAQTMIFFVSIVIAAVGQSLFAIGQFMFQQVPASSWLGLAYHAPQQLGDIVVEVGDQRWLRAYGSFPHPNILAAFLSLALFLCVWVVRHTMSRRVWMFVVMAWSFICIGLFMTFSREVWLGTIVGFILLVFWCRRFRWRGEGISPYILMGVCSVLIFLSLSIVYWEPLSGRLGIGGFQRLEQKSIQERLLSYKDGLSLVRSSPLIGVGMSQSTNALYLRDKVAGKTQAWYAYQPPHNMYLLIMCELGIVGFALLGIFIFLLIFPSLRHIQLSADASLFLSIIVMMSVSGMFDHFFWTIQSGVMIWWIAFAFLYSNATLNEFTS